MEEQLMLTALVAVFLAGAAGVILYQKAKRNQWLYRKIRNTYGKWPEREYEYDEFEAISHYFRLRRKNQETFTLDDITWNDLEMDKIFMLLNHTWSSVGESCLYALLRTPCFSEEELKRRDQLIRFFETHSKQREKLEFFFANVGKSGRRSMYDYIYNLADQEPSPVWKELIWTAGIALCVGGIFFKPEAAVPSLIAVMAFAWGDYYKKKRKIEPYIMSCAYLLHVLKNAEKLENMELGPGAEYVEKMKTARKRLDGFKHHTFFVMAGSGTDNLSGGLEKMLLDYVNFTFHLDLIQFSGLIREIQKNLDAFEELTENMGMLECATALASFRTMMPEHCTPKFSDRAEIQAENLYHPLIQEPVKNSLHVSRGVLLTGSNASGKSTFLKTVAVNAILAQTVYTCMADSFETSFFQVYSSMALRDDLTGKESYYIVEIRSLKRVLDALGKGCHVLTFVDEVLRGTNTVERIAASSQILKSMCRPDSLCFAATHDIELTYILEKEYENFHFQEEVKEDEVLFDYSLRKGRATSRNAIRLLHVMGYPDAVIEIAEERAEHFLETGNWT